MKKREKTSSRFLKLSVITLSLALVFFAVCCVWSYRHLNPSARGFIPRKVETKQMRPNNGLENDSNMNQPTDQEFDPEKGYL